MPTAHSSLRDTVAELVTGLLPRKHAKSRFVDSLKTVKEENSGGCYDQRSLSQPITTGPPLHPAFEGDEGAVTRTQSSRRTRWDTAEEMYDKQL